MIYQHLKTPIKKFTRTSKRQSFKAGSSRQRSIPDNDSQSRRQRQISFPAQSPSGQSGPFDKFCSNFANRMNFSQSRNSNEQQIDQMTKNNNKEAYNFNKLSSGLTSQNNSYMTMNNKHTISARSNKNGNTQGLHQIIEKPMKKNTQISQNQVSFSPTHKFQNDNPQIESIKKVTQKKYGYGDIDYHDLWMIKDFQIDPRDHKLLIPFQQVIDLQLQHVEKSHKDKIKKWLSSMFQSVTSDAYYKYMRDQLSTQETKNYTSKNYILNIHRFMQKINQGEDKNKLFRDQAFSFINQQSKKIVKQLKVRYPQASLAGGSTRKFKKTISRPDNSQSMQFDLLFAKKGQKINFNYNQSCQYMPQIMKTLNYLIGISSQGFHLKNDLFTKFQAFQHMLTYIFKFSKFSDTFFNEKISNRNNSSIYTNYHNFKDKTNFWQKAQDFQQVFDQQIENGRKITDTEFSIGKKIPDQVQLFTQQQIQTGDITITHGSVLRTVTKWAEQLRQKLKDPQQHIMNRVQFFKTKDGKLVQLSKQHKKLLANAAIQQQKRISNIFSTMQSHYIKLQEQIFNHDYQGSHLNNFDTNLAIISGRTQMCIGQYMVIYLNQLIHSMCRIPILAAKKLSLTDPDRTLLSSIDLITCRIGDLLRGKVKGKQNQIISIYKFIQNLSQKLPQVFKIIKLKDRLQKKDKDVLITFMFLNQVKCQIQLSISTQVDKKQKKYNQFNHFLYQLQRAQFGPIAEAACIVAKYDPISQKSFSQLVQNSLLTQKCKRYLNQIYKQLNMMTGGDSKQLQAQQQKAKKSDQVQKYLPFFCQGCQKLIQNRNPDFFQKRVHTQTYQQCNQCAGKRIISAKQKKYALLALAGLSQKKKLSKSQSVQVQKGIKNAQQQLMLELFRQNYQSQSIQMEKLLTHFRIVSDPNLKNIKQFGIIFTKNNKRPTPMFYKTMIYQNRIHFVTASDRQKQKYKAKSILSLNLKSSQKKVKLKINQYYILNSKDLIFQENKVNNTIIMKCNCCKVTQMQISQYFSCQNIVYIDNMKHLNQVKRSQKQTLYLADRNLTKELYNINQMRSLKRIFVNNCGLKDMKFLYQKRQNKDINKQVNKIGEQMAENQNINSSQNINDITQMVFKFPNLQYLNISNNQISQILPVNNVRILKCQENKIKSIQGLGKNQFIQQLDISNNTLISLKGIQLLPSLKKLICNFNLITGIDQRSYLLQYLQIKENRLTSLKGIQKFPKLITLNSSLNQIEKIGVIAQCPLMQYLNLNGNKLSDLQGIQKFKSLKKLQLNYNQITTLNKVLNNQNKLLKLEQLTLVSNSLQNLQGIQKFKNIKYLNCNNNKIQTIQIQKTCKTLQYLSLQINHLKNLQGLQKYISLKYLNCSNNKISSLIYQSNIQIRSLSNIFISKLQEINISSNILISLKGIQQYPVLKKIQCSGNKIIQLDIKRVVLNLQILKINRNQLKNLNGIQNCKSLNVLYCSNNPLTFYGNFVKLQKLRELEVGEVSHTVLKSLNQLRQVKSLKGFCKMAKQAKPFHKQYPILGKLEQFVIHTLVPLPSAQSRKCQSCKKTIQPPYYWCKWQAGQQVFRCRGCTQKRDQWSFYSYKNNSVLMTGTYNPKILEKRLGQNVQPQDHTKTQIPNFKCRGCQKKPSQKMARYICLCCKSDVDTQQKQMIQLCQYCMQNYLDNLDKSLKKTLEKYGHENNHPWLRVLFQVKKGITY